ncbi:uncharacterized protein LOC110676696 [Aedes aegypti]|uniref:Uncharacterized protein n=1 Tax=Aedes aegypti TaxID=7159 RepID=A0A6I8U6X5_AEDAE|nr:uncharacterized protein LOC110676696 [Aedes aegypti]
MKTSRFICCCAIVVIVSTAVGSTFADQSTKERIRIHKEWLARRAASRVNTNSTQRTTYLRKLIKFKNEHEPLSENDISFVPHFAHNNRDNEYHQEGGGGSGGTEGTRGDTVESRGELQQDSDNEYGLRPVGSVANPDDMSEQQSQADRYRYNVASEMTLYYV